MISEKEARKEGRKEEKGKGEILAFNMATMSFRGLIRLSIS